MKKFLIALSGARYEVLERCPTDHGRFEGVGGAVLTTSVLAAVSMTFAMHSALGVPLVAAIPASLLWGLAIMSLDRWVVGTMQAGSARRWRLALPRMLMAVLLGAVISTPLVLQIFKSEINAQMLEIKQKKGDTFALGQERGTVGRQVEKLYKEVTDLRKVISSGGDVALDPNQDPKIKALTVERDAEQIKADKRYAEWNCQRYGGPTCPSKGPGPLAQDRKRALDKAKRRVDLINGQIEDRKKELTTTGTDARQARLDAAKAALPATQEQLDAARKRQSALQASFDAENLATNGLLIRLQALNEVAGRDLTLRTAQVLLFLLFLLIECLPVLVKLMQRPGNYEKVLELAARQEFRDARISFAATSSVPPTPGSAGSESLWDVWSRPDDVPRTAPIPASQQGAGPSGPSGTFPNPVDLDDEHGSFEDDALRTMRDTRVTRHVPGSPVPSPERSGEFELLPDDD